MNEFETELRKLLNDMATEDLKALRDDLQMHEETGESPLVPALTALLA